MNFHLKTGDLSPSLPARLVDGDANPVDLSTIGELHFHMDGNNIEPIDAVAVVVAPETGDVRYDWQEGDTDVPPGTYRGEFRVTAGGIDTTFPNNDYIRIVIRAAIPDAVDS